MMRVPLLGEIPLDMETRAGGDAGRPIVSQGESAQSRRFAELARVVIERAEETRMRARPTMTVAD